MARGLGDRGLSRFLQLSAASLTAGHSGGGCRLPTGYGSDKDMRLRMGRKIIGRKIFRHF